MPDEDIIKEALENGTAPGDSTHKIISSEIKRINKALVNYKHIKSVELREEEFEKTTTRKIMKRGDISQLISKRSGEDMRLRDITQLIFNRQQKTTKDNERRQKTSWGHSTINLVFINILLNSF